jgi:hypothetical protein
MTVALSAPLSDDPEEQLGGELGNRAPDRVDGTPRSRGRWRDGSCRCRDRTPATSPWPRYCVTLNPLP